MNVGYGSGWTAALDLQFERAKDRSIVSRCRHNGPLRVQKPFYPEDGVCHVYLLHPPGGVVGGDELSVSVRAGKGSAALITTPGATRVYRSAGPLSTIKYQLNVEAGASLEWLPQDSILYGGSRLSQEMEVRVASGSRFCGWDITSMGRPASGDHYSTGEFDQGFRLYVDSLPVLMERQRWRAGAEAGAVAGTGRDRGRDRGRGRGRDSSRDSGRDRDSSRDSGRDRDRGTGSVMGIIRIQFWVPFMDFPRMMTFCPI